MKKVFSNTDMAIHVWAQRTQSEGRNSTSSVFFENTDNLYSYGYHFPLATFLETKKGDILAILNDDKYSVTTSAQQSTVRQASSQYCQIRTTTEILKLIIQYRHDHKNEWFINKIKAVCEQDAQKIIEACSYSVAKRKKQTLIDGDIHDAISNINQLRDVLALFTLKLKPSTLKRMDDLTNQREKVLAKFKAQIAKENAEKLRRQKEREAHLALVLESAKAKWLAHDRLDYAEGAELRSCATILLRINEEKQTIETSKNAEFPISDAVKVFRKIKHCKEKSIEWEKGAALPINHLGHFAVDRIYANGDVKAGCHNVKWPQIESIAKQLKLI